MSIKEILKNDMKKGKATGVSAGNFNLSDGFESPIAMKQEVLMNTHFPKKLEEGCMNAVQEELRTVMAWYCATGFLLLLCMAIAVFLTLLFT
ncbi:hypothetical protein [Methanothermobacter sp.]|uniref:hypothetical protein n=1 Tax=Methanothermobacter sp. TaxID=1884223 RepID=UPI003C74FCB3